MPDPHSLSKILKAGTFPGTSVPYQPDMNNIMAYVHPDCMTRFTPGQGRRMKNTIKMTPVLQACLVTAPPLGTSAGINVIINKNTVWTPAANSSVLITGDLIVESGATLTIEQGVRVTFLKNSHLIIQPNARVRLSGVLTSAAACNNDIWQGVEVWGNQTATSQYAIGGVRGQGILEGRPGSLIENAETAVKLYNRQDFRGRGGQIYCTGTTFKNNAIRRNTYSGMQYANLANGNNAANAGSLPRGLTYECNYHYDIRKYDISVATGAVKSKQGLEIDPGFGLQLEYNAAGNYFSYGDGFDIGNNGSPFEYFYNPDNLGEEPLAIQGPINKSEAPENNCDPIYCDPDCYQSAVAPATMQAKEEYFKNETAYQALLEETIASPDREIRLALHLRRMDENAQRVLAAFWRDTLQHQKDSILLWTSRLRTPEADLWQATRLAAESNPVAAQQVLASATVRYQLTPTEQSRFSEYAALLLWLSNNNIWSADSLTGNISSVLLTDAQSENPYVRMLTRNILTLYGEDFPPLYSFPAEESEERGNGYAIEQSNLITVRPNPAKELAIFEINTSENISGVLHIFDRDGRLIAAFSAFSSKTPITWHTQSGDSGFYYYRFISSGTIFASGRLFVNN